MGWLGAILPKVIGFVPVLGPLIAQLLSSWSTRNVEAEKAEAEAKKIEAEAFKAGRVSPRYLFGYAKVFLYVMFAILIVVALFTGDPSVTDDVVEQMHKAGKIVEGMNP